MESGRKSRAFVALAVVALGVAALILSAWFTCGFRGCPNVEALRAYSPAGARLAARERSAIGTSYGVKWPIVRLASLPHYVPEAFVAVEDRRFYRHHGVDWKRIPGAIAANVRHGGFAQGFSTITMQLARNLFPNRLPAAEKSPIRKLAEMRVAGKIERRFSKPEILQMYLNRIYFGRGAYGIETASLEYFGKPARSLTVSEAALLAGLPQAPSRLNPRSDREAAESRRNQVLDRMVEQGFITPAQAETAKSARIRLQSRRI